MWANDRRMAEGEEVDLRESSSSKRRRRAEDGVWKPAMASVQCLVYDFSVFEPEDKRCMSRSNEDGRERRG